MAAPLRIVRSDNETLIPVGDVVNGQRFCGVPTRVYSTGADETGTPCVQLDASVLSQLSQHALVQQPVPIRANFYVGEDGDFRDFQKDILVKTLGEAKARNAEILFGLDEHGKLDVDAPQQYLRLSIEESSDAQTLPLGRMNVGGKLIGIVRRVEKPKNGMFFFAMRVDAQQVGAPETESVSTHPPIEIKARLALPETFLDPSDAERLYKQSTPKLSAAAKDGQPLAIGMDSWTHLSVKNFSRDGVQNVQGKHGR